MYLPINAHLLKDASYQSGYPFLTSNISPPSIACGYRFTNYLFICPSHSPLPLYSPHFSQPTMALKLVEVVNDDEFNDIVRCEFDSYETPVCKLKDLFFPIKGEPTAENRDAAIKEAIARQTLWHRSDPSSLWIKVVDQENGKVAGAACWHIYDANPFAEPAEGECDWWPAGERRDMANTLMGQFLTPRMTWMAKPHVRK